MRCSHNLRGSPPKVTSGKLCSKRYKSRRVINAAMKPCPEVATGKPTDTALGRKESKTPTQNREKGLPWWCSG